MNAPAILEQYVTSADWPRNAIDIFKGEWFSRLPEPYESLTGGTACFSSDARLTWFAEAIGGLRDKTVLELGPLEGGHSYLLEKLGAREVVAIEGNTRAFLKCLIVKELFGLTKTRFLCGDIIDSLRRPEPPFDVCIASGVLYHMQNPAEMLFLVAQRCKQNLLLWTHYFDETHTPTEQLRATKEHGGVKHEYRGFKHTLYRYDYRAALQWKGFCGGSASFSEWMSRDDILKCLEFVGFTDLRIGFDDPQNANGPSLAVVATRRQ
jgi:hypothetical protein